MLQARCSFPGSPDSRFLLPPLPFGTLTSLRIKVFSRYRRSSARLPNPPDFLSLPAARSNESLGCGSSFQVRYVSAGLLFLKPLGTSLTMLPKRISVNAFSVRTGTFSTRFIWRIFISLQRSSRVSPVHKTFVCHHDFAIL